MRRVHHARVPDGTRASPGLHLRLVVDAPQRRRTGNGCHRRPARQHRTPRVLRKRSCAERSVPQRHRSGRERARTGPDARQHEVAASPDRREPHHRHRPDQRPQHPRTRRRRRRRRHRPLCRPRCLLRPRQAAPQLRRRRPPRLRPRPPHGSSHRRRLRLRRHRRPHLHELRASTSASSSSSVVVLASCCCLDDILSSSCVRTQKRFPSTMT
mmetsp:Transcript_10109/g.30655  ORF Transcript_10109/g.30655 Transcript_10109/m.30655 type:complete len:212 (-) Transcript_10109:85-720(-)